MEFSEVQRHNSRDDCWVAIHGNCYNVTNFLAEHPGGEKVILKLAGKDASEEFAKFHPPDMLELYLPKEMHLGPVMNIQKVSLAKEKSVKAALPPLDSVLNLWDFENLARLTLNQEAWAYYSSASDNEITLQENTAVFKRVYLKPRVLRNVKKVDPSAEFFGIKCDMPIYITATALGRLGHPDGETVLTRAAGTRNIIQMMPTLASCSFDEMLAAAIDSQTQWFQLYVNSNRSLTSALIEKAQNAGIKAICVTVDAPQLGRREKDIRVKFQDDAPNVQGAENVKERNAGAARAISTFIDPSLCWDDVPFLRSVCKIPLLLKGIQCGEDAVLAAQAGVDGIIVSNHGGRQLDTCRSALEILEEVTQALKMAGYSRKFKVYLDGGVRRGSDIFKAIAMGADGIGLGRPFLFAMSTYGQEGVEKVIDLLREELEMVMRLMGVTSLSQICRDMVLTNDLTRNRFSSDSLSKLSYQKLEPLTLLQQPLKSKI